MDSEIQAVVIGDAMLDSWLRGPVKRIAQEAPVPVVSVEATDDAPGGAGNAAANLAALGARVRLIGTVGDDDCADKLARALGLLGVDARMVTVPGRRTPHKQRLMVGEQLIARYDEEDREPIPAEAETRVIAELREALPGADVVIACDYEAGVCTDAVRRALTGLPLLVVDAHAIGPWRACAPSAVLPNYREALRLLREDGDRADRIRFLTERSERLLAESGARMVVTTLDGEGTLLHRPGLPPYRTYAEPAPDHMATGAGDTFTAAFALWL
ncbi:PfkB family carbohydrate kinase, partial [Nonomuraea sp. MCN248]